MILKLIAIIAIAIVAILIFAAFKPRIFEIQRSIAIKARPDKIFALINDLHRWPEWEPQDREDPTIRRTYSGPASGEGAICQWSGSGKAGKGQMIIRESVPASRIKIEVDFAKPFKAHNVNQFTLEPIDDGTRVIWRMHGPNLYVMRLMSVFINMDTMMGKHFEAGLNNLKVAAEK
jgi:uncharacterized protein YndB with AHSA1/START domain